MFDFVMRKAWCLISKRLCWGPTELLIPLAALFNLLALVVSAHVVRTGMGVELNPLVDLGNPLRAYARSLSAIIAFSLVIVYFTRRSPKKRLLLLSLLLSLTAANFAHDIVLAITDSVYLALVTMSTVAAFIPFGAALRLLPRTERR